MLMNHNGSDDMAGAIEKILDKVELAIKEKSNNEK